MLHKCANPLCPTVFRSLGHGKLFQIESRQCYKVEAGLGGRRPAASRQVEFYWLCDRCCASLTLTPEKFGGVAAVPLPVLSRRTPPVPQIWRRA